MSDNLSFNWFRLKKDHICISKLTLRVDAWVDWDKIKSQKDKCALLKPDNVVHVITLMRPPLSCSLSFSRASTARLISRWRRRPKSRNMVEPPDNTIFFGQHKKKRKKITIEIRQVKRGNKMAENQMPSWMPIQPYDWYHVVRHSFLIGCVHGAHVYYWPLWWFK